MSLKWGDFSFISSVNLDLAFLNISLLDTATYKINFNHMATIVEIKFVAHNDSCLYIRSLIFPRLSWSD